MIPGILILVGMLYAAIAVVFYLHEIGHFGDKVNFKLGFPLPTAWSYQTRLQYGGLAVNGILFFLVWYYRPELFFLQVIGLIAWTHFIWYAIWGSFNHEPRVPKWLWKYWVFDDVSNEHWWIAVPIAIAVFWYLKEYYIQVAISLLQMV